VSRRAEWTEQVRLAALLDRWLPDDAYWTATDPVAGSATSGLMRKRRGVKPGVPDLVVWHRGRSITIELKSPHGQCNRAQRAARAGLLRARVDWWECRSANAAMWALSKSGVRFDVIVHNDGTTQRWWQPQLAPWEVPRRDPAEPRPRAHPLPERPGDGVRRHRVDDRQQADALPGGPELGSQLVGDDTAERVPADVVRAFGLDLAQGRIEVPGQVLDRPPAVEPALVPLGQQAVDRLVGPERGQEVPEREQRALVRVDEEQRWPAAGRAGPHQQRGGASVDALLQQAGLALDRHALSEE